MTTVKIEGDFREGFCEPLEKASEILAEVHRDVHDENVETSATNTMAKLDLVQSLVLAARAGVQMELDRYEEIREREGAKGVH